MRAMTRWWSVLSLLSLLLTLSASGPQARADEAGGASLVTIGEVHVRLSDHGPVVLLSAEGKTVRIFVDHTVAGSIQSALTGTKLPRPLSHDLMHSILEALGGRVVKTVITLKAGTYYGTLTVAFQGQEKVFDSRSSDSIALAIHFKAPILVDRAALDAVSSPIPDSKPQTL
ncbi:MAG: bifunctional nuclease family protein [Nitrospira sp.]|nr:bifunctional nuclease family protein [Nitrospira sp.]MBA3752730.1 bifunctional nuclease family protein [Nitrospira sp.]